MRELYSTLHNTNFYAKLQSRLKKLPNFVAESLHKRIYGHFFCFRGAILIHSSLSDFMQSQTLRFFFFFLMIGILQALIDSYVIIKWRKYVRRRTWSAYFYRIPIGLAMLFFCLSAYATWQRQINGVPNVWGSTMSVLLALWYLPKLPISIVMAITDIGKAIVLCWEILRKKITSAPTPTSPILPTLPEQKAAQQHNESELKSTTPSSSRRDFLQTAGWALAGTPFVIMSYGMAKSLYDFQVYRIDIPMKNLPRQFDGMTIAQISDIHAGSFLADAPVQEIVRITNELQSDMIIISGDWVNARTEEIPRIAPYIPKLSAPLGVWGSLGNHDHYMSDADHQRLITWIRSTGTNLLINQSTIFDIDGEYLNLAITDNIGLRQYFGHLPTAMAKTREGASTILVSHDPTFWDIAVREKTTIDLMLSGHTHGGQFGVEFGTKQFGVAQMVYKQWAGLYSEGAQHLYVNRGVGTTGVPARIGIPPEITYLTLRKA